MEINFTILGVSNSGKTCYLTGMYRLMTLGYSGFTLNSSDKAINRRLEKMWEGINSSGEERRFPDGTEKISDYQFILNHCYDPIVAFNWHDYRGGVLEVNSEQRNNGEYERDWNDLLKRIKNSHCVIMCFPGNLLPNNKARAKQNAKEKAGLRNINELFTEMQGGKNNNFVSKFLNRAPKIKDESSSLLSVILMVTKSDMCLDKIKTESHETINTIKQMYQPVFKKEWLTMMCPITLGENLNELDNEADIDPINLHIPVAFGIVNYLKKAIDGKILEKEQYEKDIKDLQNDRFLLGRWLNREEIGEYKDQKSEIEEQVDKLKLDIESLEKVIKEEITDPDLGFIKVFKGDEDITGEFYI